MGTREVLVVVQKDDHSLGCYDLLTGVELRRVSIPRYPHEFAISADGRYAYSCHFGLKLAEDVGPGGDEVSVVDLHSGQWVRSISCNGWRRPHGIAIDEAGRLYVLSEGTSRLLVIPDPGTGVIARTLDTGGAGSHIVSVTGNGVYAFCSNMVSHTVSRLHLADEGSVAVIVPVGARPEGSAFDADEQRLLVCNRESSDITIIDVESGAPAARIATPPGPVRIQRRGSADFVVACYHDQSMIVVDADAGTVTHRIALPGKPVSASYDAGSGMALAGLLPSGIAVVDVEANQVARIIPSRAGPDPMAVLRLAI